MSEKTWNEYAKDIKYFDIEEVRDSFAEIDAGEECAGGACPIR